MPEENEDEIDPRLFYSEYYEPILIDDEDTEATDTSAAERGRSLAHIEGLRDFYKQLYAPYLTEDDMEKGLREMRDSSHSDAEYISKLDKAVHEMFERILGCIYSAP